MRAIYAFFAILNAVISVTEHLTGNDATATYFMVLSMLNYLLYRDSE